MVADGENETPVKVLVRLRGGGPQAEGLWAAPVDASDAGGTYRLANNGFLCPLVIDDVVEAWLDGDSRLQVTGVRERGGRRGWLIRFADGVDKTTIQGLVDEWSSTGTAVERHHPRYARVV